MYMCDRGIEFTSVSTFFRLVDGIVFTVRYYLLFI